MTRPNRKGAAQRFAEYRASAKGFDDYPGPVPTGLADAYATLEAAIEIWNEPIAGWKVGRIVGALEEKLGENRFIGPIFAGTVVRASGGTAAFPVIRGGFAALEAEMVAVIEGPLTAEEGPWTAESCAGKVARWHVGIEVAGSPLSTINDLGPLASIAGFGNNNGLLVGPEVAIADPRQLECRVTIGGGKTVGPVPASGIPGGPLAGVAFALNKLAELGHEVPDGLLISTGAITGVHEVGIGCDCRAVFEPGGTLDCRTVPQEASRS